LTRRKDQSFQTKTIYYTREINNISGKSIGEMMNKNLLAVIAFSFCYFVILVGINYSQKQFTIDAIYSRLEFSDKSLDNFQWIPHSQKFSYFEGEENRNLWSYDLISGKRELLLNSEQLSEFKTLKRVRRVIPESYFWSPDGEAILLNSGKYLSLYSLKSKLMQKLIADDASPKNPVFSPDGKKIAYIKKYNIYVYNIAAKEEKQLTTAGTEHLLTGRLDWVYEEEFGIRTGFFWSPNSKYIAFFQQDESLEPEFPIVDYIPILNETSKLRYPKPGDHNAIVKIGVVNVENPQITWMDIGEEVDIYIPRIKWLHNSKTLAIHRLNRQQNFLELLFADIKTGKSKTILEEREENSWLEINDDLTFLKERELFIWSSDRTGFNHLYLYDIKGKLICPLTKGNWDVKSLIKVDEKNSRVYFISTAESIFERHFYSVNLQGKEFTKLTKQIGSHSIKMHPDCNYYLDYFSNYTTPTKISLYTADCVLKDVIEPNKIEALKEYKLSTPEIFSFTTDDGITLNAAITKPVDFDPAKKYPVVFTVYGGPGSQTVLNTWGDSGYLWRQLLTQKGYIVFQLDNRGTTSRGSKFMKQMYRKLGHYEVLDMINGVKYLRTLPYIDEERIGIWGWSYGGYTAIMCMLNAAEYFKVGVAVAPVTDWRNYDTVYTERFMDTPQNNKQGYNNSSTKKYVNKLKGKLLLIHGAADDNVHLSNTLQLAYEFQRLNKQFDLMIYPRKEHSIRKVRGHLFTKITDYFLDNL